MKVSALPTDPGPAGWNAILPARAPGAPLAENMVADWVIVGAGFAGLAAARRLRQLHPSDRIVLLEARGIADGPVGRNSGFMIDIPHHLTSSDYAGQIEADLKELRMHRRAIDFALTAADEFQMPAEAVVKSGKINSAAGAKGIAFNKALSAHLAALGEPSELLDAQQMQAVTGIAYYRSGLFTPGSVMLQPALYARGMADGLQHSGVSIFEQSPVIDIKQQADCWRLSTPNARIEAPRVILTVNGHIESFGHFARRLVHIYLYASMTRPLSADEVSRLGGHADWGVTPSDPSGTTVRKISGPNGHRIIIRNGMTYNPDRTVGPILKPGLIAQHRKSFAARFPMLPDVEFKHSWGGQLCLSRNDVPAFGNLVPGVYAACCQNGLGSAKGSIAGILAAEQASNVASEELTDMLAMAPPTRLPPEPVAALGANLTMAWRQWRAGREL